ncbi:MAG: SGNH/GDSL hydrolase family protein [Geminicoccaceae bacterium]
MKKVVTLILGNLLVLGFLVFSMNTLSIAAIKVYNWTKPLEHAEAHLLPNYGGAEWARKHFSEYRELGEADYAAYYGWRRPAFAGETINIDERGMRRTYRDRNVAPERTIAFFGGSTIWGTGADDDRTIPSEFVKLNPEYAGYNFGETGFVAHQSLNAFLERYFEGFRPDVVVFYDGVNDVGKCRSEMGPYAHAREVEIRTALHEAGGGAASASFVLTVLPIRNLIGKVRRVLGNQSRAEASFYDCHENPEKAAQIARVLLSDWLIVKNLVEAYGGTFVPILQPVIYFSDTKADHLKLSESLRWQYEILYPLIVDMIDREFPQLAGNFMDLRDALDRDEYFYIDWCHLSPNGNHLVAERISQGIAARTGKAMAARSWSGSDR